VCLLGFIQPKREVAVVFGDMELGPNPLAFIDALEGRACAYCHQQRRAPRAEREEKQRVGRSKDYAPALQYSPARLPLFEPPPAPAGSGAASALRFVPMSTAGTADPAPDAAKRGL